MTMTTSLRAAALALAAVCLLAPRSGFGQPAPTPAPVATPRAVPAPKRRVRTLTPHRPKLAQLDERVVKQVVEMLTAYERRSVPGMRKFISGGFRSRDDLGFGNSTNQVALSFAGDFRNLRDIDFDVTIFPPQYSADFRSARVDLQFNRRARFAVSGQEWIVRNQRTTLNFDIGGPTSRVSAVQGAPMMGLTNPVGVLIVDRGNVDGVPVVGAQSVLNGRLGAGSQDLLSFGNFRRQASPVGVILPPTVPPTVPPPTVVVTPTPTPTPTPVVPQSDVRIAAADIVFSAGEPPSVVANGNGAQLDVTVHNDGTLATAGFDVSITYRNNTQANQATQNFSVPAIAPGGTFTINNALFIVASVQGDSITITAIGDIGATETESNEANNTGIRNVVMGP